MLNKTAVLFLTSLFIFTSSQITYSQTQKKQNNQPIVEADDSQFYQTGSLRSDYAVSDVVVYVDVKERKLEDFIGKGDCENDKGTGYCLYRLTAQVKEVFKGGVTEKTIEFFTSPDAGYPKKYLMGEKVVFLIRNENEKDMPHRLGTIENSTRSIKSNILEKMRGIIDPRAAIDDADESEPYSMASIRKDFADAEVVILADVTNFKSAAEDFGMNPVVSEAVVKEVFKGRFKPGQKIEYKTDLLYRPLRREDLGEKVIFLKREADNGKVFYKSLSYTISRVQYNILEKLRKIARKK